MDRAYRKIYGLGSNFCRNPEGLGETVWCYTTDPDKIWEYCDELNAEESEGLWGWKGSEYTGLQTTTKKGKTCQAWDMQEPHMHIYEPGNYPYANLDSNYCRNPLNGETGKTIWCYTTDFILMWDYCDPIHEE